MNKVLIGLYEFDGPYDIDISLENLPGVVALMRHSEDELELVQLKASNNVAELLCQLRSRYRGWRPQELSVAVHYTPGLSRGEANRIIHDIFDEFEMAAA